MSRRKLGGASVSISDLRVLACGVALKQYPRDDMLWEGLSRAGIAKLIDLRHVQNYLDEYQNSLNKKDATRTKNRSLSRRIVRQIYSRYSFFKYVLSILQTIRKEKIDIVFVFPRNYHLAICLGLLKFFHGAKVYFDLYVSMYSIAISNSLGRFAVIRSWLKEFLSIKFADQLICETPGYARYLSKLYKTRIDKFSAVHIGVQDIWFDEPVSISHEVQRPKRVLYWGTFLIQHGLDVILGAAEELRNENIEFIFCGGGKKEAWVKEEVRKRKLRNVVFKGFIPTTKELIHLVDSADVCLGFFRDTHDAQFSIPIKVQQGMARSKPVITLWNKHMEDTYRTKDNPFPPLILIIPDSKSLAKAIMGVIKDCKKAEKIGDAARLTVKRLHGVEAVTSQLRVALEKALKQLREEKNEL